MKSYVYLVVNDPDKDKYSAYGRIFDGRTMASDSEKEEAEDILKKLDFSDIKAPDYDLKEFEFSKG